MNRHSHDLSKRARAMSAKAPSTRSRPMSSYTSKNFQKTQGLQQIYNGRDTSPNRKTPQKSIIYQGMNTQELIKFKRHSAFKTNKDKEQLYEQTMKLKREKNKLEEELMILKGKFQAKGRKTKERNKQLDIEFEKPLYWGGSKTHLISGIKFQYDKLQKDYIALEKQLTDAKVQILQTKSPQLQIYSSQLQRQNNRLKAQLSNLINAHTSVPNQTNRQMISYLYAESQQNKRKLEEKLIQIDTRLHTANQALKDSEQKVSFMQKLLIQKDNRGYHLHRKLIRLQKILQSKEEQISALQKEMNKINNENQRNTTNLKEQSATKFRSMEDRLKNEIDKRDKVIRNLEDENKQMEGLINKLRMNSTGNFGNSMIKSNVRNSQQVNHPLLFNKNSQQAQDQMVNSRQMANFASTLSNYKSEPNSITPNKGEKQPRERKTAQKKYSQNALKLRKVDHSQVVEIALLLKYRMIGNEVDNMNLKQYFNCQPQILAKLDQIKSAQNSGEQKKQQNSTANIQQEQLSWQKEYMSMRQCKQILKSKPFCLTQQQAHLVARYAIEDATTQFIYCDEENQNKREIVKSIIRSLIGQYQVGSKQQEEKLNDFMEKYAGNLESALMSYYPGGRVSHRKFIDVFSSIGYQHADEIKDALLGRLVLHAQNLDALKYSCLFNSTDN